MPSGVHDSPRGGRKPSIAATVTGTFRLPLSLLLMAKRLGGEAGVSEGIRLALQEAKENTETILIDVLHPTLGPCVFMTDHAASSHGQPVLVAADRRFFGPGDVPAGELSEPLPGLWTQSERAVLTKWSGESMGPLRWNIAL